MPESTMTFAEASLTATTGGVAVWVIPAAFVDAVGTSRPSGKAVGSVAQWRCRAGFHGINVCYHADASVSGMGQVGALVKCHKESR